MNKRRKGRCVRMAWRNQLENPALPIIVYLAVVGLLSVASGGVAPQPVEVQAPAWLTHSWAGALAIGGVLGVAGCLTGRTRAESAGLALLLFGLSLYGLAEGVTGAAGDGVETVAALLALSACCIIRLRVLHLARRAVKVAQRHLRGVHRGD